MKLTLTMLFLLFCLMGTQGPANRGQTKQEQKQVAVLVKTNPLLKQLNYFATDSALARLRIRKV